MSILLTEILYRFFSFFHLDFSFSNTWIEQIEGCISDFPVTEKCAHRNSGLSFQKEMSKT